MIIPRHEYEDMQRHIKTLQAANSTLKLQVASLKLENQILMTMIPTDNKIDFPNSSTGNKIEYPISSVSSKSSDNIY